MHVYHQLDSQLLIPRSRLKAKRRREHIVHPAATVYLLRAEGSYAANIAWMWTQSNCTGMRNALRVGIVCKMSTFWTSQLPKVLREWCALYIFWLRNLLRATTACNFSSLISPDGSAPAALASLLFDPPELQNIWKTQQLVTFLPFRAPASSFFWLFLFSDLLSSSLLFSDSSHLCFFICRKFDF